MMLAILIIACVVVALIAGALARRETPGAPVLVVLSIATPVAAFLLMLASAPERGSNSRLEVIGQYHPLGAPVVLATATDADLRIDSTAIDRDTRVTLTYEGESSLVSVNVLGGAEPVVLSGTLINGRPLTRHTTLGHGEFRTELTRPWWCWYRCSARRIDVWTSGVRTASIEASIDTVIRLPLGNGTVTVFRHARRDHIVGDPQNRFTVNGAEVALSASAPAGLLEIGMRNRFAIDVRTHVDAQRMDLLFAENVHDGWDLAGSDNTRRVLVTATAEASLPGTLPVVNPAAVAPGAARVPYGGVLERADDDAWTWQSGGESRALRSGMQELIPGNGAGEAGHIVVIGQSQTDSRGARNAAVIAWLLGAALLAWTWRHLGTETLPPRVALLGLFNTIVFVRGILALRAWMAPPHTDRAPITFLAMLLAMPALIACYHSWQDATRHRTSLPALFRSLIPVYAFLALGFAAIAFLVPRAWLGSIAVTTIVPLVIGTFGLAALQRLLVTRAATGPFGAFDVDAGTHSGYRQFLSAASTLAVLGAALFILSRLEHTGRLIALAICSLLGAIVLVAAGEGSAIVRRSRPQRRLLLAAALALVGGGAAYSFTGTMLALPVGVIIGGWIGWWRGGPQPLVRPIRFRELMPPWLLIGSFIAVMITISLGLTGRIRVTMEYALAIGGLIVVARIFALAWAPHVHDYSTEAAEMRPLPPRRFTMRDVFGMLAVLSIAAVIYVPLGLTDPGLVLLYFSAATVAVLVGLHTLHRHGRLLAGALLIALVLSAVATMYVREGRLTRATGELSTPQARFAGAYHAQELEGYLLRAPESSPLEIVRTLQQYWGTDQYAAMGKTTGSGYFNTEFSSYVVPRPVALTENVFSVFVLSEHGWIGGVAVLLLYLMVALALLSGALLCTSRPEHHPRAIFLTGLAGFIAIPALYMAASNGRIVPLTGQNMPMLGLLSIADAALGTWLAALAITALPIAVATGAVHAMPGERAARLRRGVISFGAGMAVLTAVLAALLWRPTHAEPKPFRLDTLAAEAEGFVSSGALIVDADTIAIAQTAAQHPALAQGTLLRRGIRTSNRISRGERMTGNCYDVDPMFRIGESDITVSGALCSVRVPSGQREAWLGPLRTDDEMVPAVLTDGRTAVILSGNAALAMASFGRGCTQPGSIRARSVRIGCGSDGAVLSAGHMMVTIESRDSSAIEINGTQPGPLAVLRPGDRLRAPGTADIVMTTLPPGAIGYARWENGRWRRLSTPFAGNWLAQIDSQLAHSLSDEKHAALPAVVTVNEALHTELRERIKAACDAVPGVRVCSVMLADPVTGEIKAYADSRGDVAPPRNLPADANLRNHPAASAIKPIIALAALKAFPSLESLVVDHTDGEVSTIANVPIEPPMRAARLYPQTRVPWAGFLPASDNLYAATLGFLATAPSRNGLPATSGSANESRLTVGGKSLTGQPAWPRARSRLRLEDSPLATALQQVYGVYPSAEGSPLIERSFWQAAIDADLINGNTDLQRITPEPVVLKLDSISSPRQLATFMIGGGENRWNNIALAQAVSRIYTGNATQLHIVRSVGDVALRPGAVALQDIEAQRHAVMSGMRGVITQTWGTAHTLSTAFPIQWVAKSGTLREREWTGSVFLFAGGADTSACTMAGVITIQLEARANPDGVATRFFRDNIAPLLRTHAGWNGTRCPTN